MENCCFYSREAKLAKEGKQSYAKAVVNAYRTREAFALAEPFSVMILGFGSEFLYRDGVLCYVKGVSIHVLNVYEAADTEMVINLPPSITGPSKRMKLMSYRDDVLAILCTPVSPGPKSTILAVDTSSAQMSDVQRIRLSQPVIRGSMPFIRHNASHLIYGYHSDSVGWHGHREWQFWHFRLPRPQEGKKLPQMISHPGMDVGLTVVFEVNDNYFQILSNQVTRDTEEQDPMSYYDLNTYDLDKNDPSPKHYRLERRQHREGPIHDSWTDLALQKDESRGGFMITETRREWQDGQSMQKRTCYMTPLENTMDVTSMLPRPSLQPPAIVDAGSSRAMTPPPDPVYSVTSLNLPPEPSPMIQRNPLYYHPEYTSDQLPSTQQEFRLAQTKHRAYNYNCSAFLDIVLDNQPPLCNPRLLQQVRLRVRSRTLRSPFNQDGSLSRDERFFNRETKMWPPLDAPPQLLDLLNAGSGVNGLEACSDGRTIVYMAGLTSSRQDKAIVLVNFDPFIRFAGLTRLNDACTNCKSSEQGPMLGSSHPVVEEARMSRFKLIRAQWQVVNRGYQLRS